MFANACPSGSPHRSSGLTYSATPEWSSPRSSASLQAAIEDLGAQTVITAVLALLAVAVLTLGSIAFFDVATPAEPPATCWQCCCSSRPCSPSGYW
jgi:hypothetical protein